MADGLVRVLGAGDESAIGEELLVRGKALDAIDLQEDGKGSDLADAGDKKDVLDVVVGNERGMQVFLQGKDLLTEQIDLLVMTLKLEPGRLGQLVRNGLVIDVDELFAVELATEVVDADETGSTLADDAESGPHDITEVTLLAGNLMSARDGIEPE